MKLTFSQLGRDDPIIYGWAGEAPGQHANLDQRVIWIADSSANPTYPTHRMQFALMRRGALTA
jgi:hypothetical protein